MIKKLYYLSPVIIQNFLCSLKGFLICRKRLNKNFKKQLSLFDKYAYQPEAELRLFLQEIRTVPYYQRLFRDFGFNVTATNLYKELLKLPIQTKLDVKTHHNDIVNLNFIGETYLLHTSGTTGGGLVFPCSREMENKQWAVWWRYRGWHGIDLNTWCGWFGGRTIISTKNTKAPFWRINYPGKQVMFSVYHLNKDTVELYYQKLKRSGLTWLHGYPSQISLLASLIADQGLTPLHFVTHVTFGAENLLEGQKQIISKVFPNAKLTQHYGLAEGVANLSQDVHGRWKIDEDFAYVEFVPISEEDPTICRIVGTGFSNYAFPLVRYDTGDIAKIERLPNGTVNVLSIDGRKEDYISLPNGVKLGRLDHIFKDLVNIQEAQIYQKSISEIEFRIVKGQFYSIADEQLLWSEIRSRITDSIKITISYVDKISRTRSGKLRLVISDVK